MHPSHTLHPAALLQEVPEHSGLHCQTVKQFCTLYSAVLIVKCHMQHHGYGVTLSGLPVPQHMAEMTINLLGLT